MQSAPDQRPAAKFFMSITAITAWAALALQQYILIDNTPGNGMTPLQAVGRFLIFFTVLSNILVAVSLTTVLLKPASAAGRFFVKPSNIAAVILYIFVVGLVYNVILRSIWHPTGRDRVADELLHVAVPLLFILYFIFFAPKAWLPWKQVFSWMIFPAAYLIYALLRGAAEGFYAYPFLDLRVLGTAKVAMNIALMMVVFIFFGLIIIAYCRSVKKK